MDEMQTVPCSPDMHSLVAHFIDVCNHVSHSTAPHFQNEMCTCYSLLSHIVTRIQLGRYGTYCGNSCHSMIKTATASFLALVTETHQQSSLLYVSVSIWQELRLDGPCSRAGRLQCTVYPDMVAATVMMYPTRNIDYINLMKQLRGQRRLNRAARKTLCQLFQVNVMTQAHFYFLPLMYQNDGSKYFSFS